MFISLPFVFESAVSANQRRLRLGVRNLVVFPKLANPWTLELRFPYWHQLMDVEVWEYTGEDVDVFQRFSELEASIG
jgi:hypothetical protein